MTQAISIIEMNDDQVIDYACQVLEKRLQYRVAREESVVSPQDAKTLVRLRLAESLYEVFAVLFLDSRHRVIAFEKLFNGTIDGASVHPREVVRRALHHNAAAAVLAHCHPSGVAESSAADRAITQRLKDALALIDVRVLDHLIVGDEVMSFAEHGLL